MLRVIKGEEVQCSREKANRIGAFIRSPCGRGASEVGRGAPPVYRSVGGEVRVPTDDQIFIEFHSDGHKTANPIVQPAEKTTQTPADSGIHHGSGGGGSAPAGVC